MLANAGMFPISGSGESYSKVFSIYERTKRVGHQVCVSVAGPRNRRSGMIPLARARARYGLGNTYDYHFKTGMIGESYASQKAEATVLCRDPSPSQFQLRLNLRGTF